MSRHVYIGIFNILRKNINHVYGNDINNNNNCTTIITLYYSGALYDNDASNGLVSNFCIRIGTILYNTLC